MHGVHRPRERFSLSSLAEEPGNFTKEIMLCRQRGHGIEPGGPIISEVILLVEQRYSAHLTQSSWEQPEKEKEAIMLFFWFQGSYDNNQQNY